MEAKRYSDVHLSAYLFPERGLKHANCGSRQRRSDLSAYLFPERGLKLVPIYTGNDMTLAFRLPIPRKGIET